MCTACVLRVHCGCTGALRVGCGCVAGALRMHRMNTACALHVQVQKIIIKAWRKEWKRSLAEYEVHAMYDLIQCMLLRPPTHTKSCRVHAHVKARLYTLRVRVLYTTWYKRAYRADTSSRPMKSDAVACHAVQYPDAPHFTVCSCGGQAEQGVPSTERITEASREE